ncbi:parallel beta-helix domain-containing protein [Mesorhizobium sp. YR577]|uniref:parallel beta-helix domain-containing protein n=1 Tax=Mesorhizobium sp. YR577 TaxID=1884373 RepID=UPI0008DEF6C7|nr:parallel beta-helix domain-containing protein [Mesorhizobium sp. YR577]SFT43499.1 parallel beta-helix repeat-containing protein [Mesorhizobium sp. YR577]
MRSLSPRAAFLTVLLTSAACGPLLAAEIPVEAGDGAAERLTEALIMAKPGDTIAIGAGKFELTEGLSLDVDDVLVKGAGPDATILSFKGQTGSGEGLLVTSDRVVLEDFAVEDSKGDGVKAKGSDQITFRNLRVEWTNGPDANNGAYGVYPVTSKNILVDGVTVKGAADAGIYVGQSENIVVRNSRAEYNVAGIEIENSMKADVYKNTATHNTGGILIFDLPNLPVQGGHDIRVFDNDVVDNDTANFAPKGNTVAMVPKGMGIMVMANRNVHVFGNRLSGNATTHVLIAAYPNEYDDDNYMFVPRGVFVHGNTYGEGGNAPDGEVGKTISDVSGTPVPSIIWDGVTRIPEYLTWVSAADRIYVDEAEGTTFANLKMISQLMLPWSTSPDKDISAYKGSLPEPAAVKLPQENGA